MIHQIDRILEKLLASDGKLDAAILFESGEPKKGQAYLSLLLFDVRENLVLRDETPRIRSAEEEGLKLKKLAPVKLDLSYVVTATAEDSIAEHELLGHALRVLYKNPVVPKTMLPEEMILDGNERILLSVSQLDHQSHQRPEAIFRAIGVPMKPAIWLTVTASFDPWETETVRVVRHALVGLGLIQPDGSLRIGDITQSQVSATGVVYASRGKSRAPLEGAAISVKGHSAIAATDRRGFFFLADLPPGKHLLQIAKDGYELGTHEIVSPPPGRVDLVSPVEVLLAPSHALATTSNDLPDYMMGFAAMTITVRGELKYPDGEPARAVLLRCGGRTTVTDQNGAYLFEGLPPKPVKLTAELTGRGEVPVKIEDGSAVLQMGTKT